MPVSEGETTATTVTLTERPAELHVRVVVGEKPLPGAFIEVELPMRRKNSYRFPIGPADSAGRLRITDEDLAAYAHRINELLLMDYVGLGAGWTREVIIRPTGRGGIQRLRQAHATWSQAGIYPPNFLSDLARLDHALAELDDRLPIEVIVDPPHRAVPSQTTL